MAFTTFPIPTATATPALVGAVAKAGDTMTGALGVTGVTATPTPAVSSVQLGQISANTPLVRWTCSAAAAGARAWEAYTTTTQWNLRMVNDDGTAAQVALRFTRSGLTATALIAAPLDVSGAVSINTASGTPIDARSSVNGYYVYGRNSTTGHYVALASDATGPRLEFGNGAGLRIADGTTNRIYLDSSGNVGVGVAPTLGVFQVAGNIRASSPGGGTGTSFVSTGGLSNFQITHTAASARVKLINSAGAGANISIGSASSEDLIVSSAGSVGIGAEPTSKLTVQGNYLTVQDGTFNGFFGKGSELVLGSPASDLGIRTILGSIRFATDNGVERMVMNMGGGIVASTPLKLAQFSLTTLPSVVSFVGHLIEVSNATGGAKICRSNGSVWQILNTTTTVS